MKLYFFEQANLKKFSKEGYSLSLPEGYLQFKIKGNMAYDVNVQVSPQYRGKGKATELYNTLKNILKGKDVNTVEQHIVSLYALRTTQKVFPNTEYTDGNTDEQLDYKDLIMSPVDSEGMWKDRSFVISTSKL